MMDPHTTLSQICEGLSSDRVTLRKKYSDSLNEYLGGSAIPKLLTENHRQSNGITWTTLFQKGHILVFKEAQKLDTGKKLNHDAVQTQCSSVLSSIISGANKFKCFITCEKLVDCCLEVFKGFGNLRTFSDIYLTLLSKYVLRVEYYLTNFTAYEWADLFEECLKLCTSDKVDRSLAVKVFMQILDEGVNRCHLVLAIRDNLPNLTNIFIGTEINRQHHMQENLLTIANTVIIKVAAESRMAVCLFAEEVMPHVIKFYEHTSDIITAKKKLLFKFLQLCLMIHHPGGRYINQSSVLVRNWVDWRRTLNLILGLVNSEATFLSQSLNRINQHGNLELCSEYVELAVDLYHQIFNGSLEVELASTSGEANPPKRCRIEQYDCSTLSQMITLTSTNYFPWLTIVAEYMKKYHKCVTNHDKKHLFQILANHILCETLSTKSTAIYDAIVSIYTTVYTDLSSEIYLEETLTIWNTCIRKVSTDSLMFDQCHNVIQSLLDINGFDAPIEALLQLYSDNSMPSTFSSFKTLSLILSYHNNKIADKNIKLNLCQWVISFGNCLRLSDYQNDVAFLLFQLCANENILKTKTNIDSDIIDKLFDSPEYLILLSDFEDELLMVNESKKNTELHSKQLCITISEKVLDNILTHLHNCIEASILKIEEPSNIFNAIKECKNILQFISYFNEYKVLNALPNMIQLSQNAFKEFSQIILHFSAHFKRMSVSERHELLNQLRILFLKDNYSSQIFHQICKTTTKEAVESFCEFINEESDVTDNVDLKLMGVQAKKNNDADLNFKNNAMEILINFCYHDSAFREQILTFILDISLYDFNCSEDFEMIIKVLSFIIKKYERENVPIGSVLGVLQVALKYVYRKSNAVYSILDLLYSILGIVAEFGNDTNRENCIILLRGVLLRCTQKMYSPKVMAQAFKCLSWIQNESKIPDWGSQMDGTLVKGLSNTIHAVRLYSCLCVGHTMKETSQCRFDEILEVLPNVFLLNEDVTKENIILDESANRTSTVLHCLASIAVISSVWDKHALAAIMQISYSKNISHVLLKKVYQNISRGLNHDSVESLIQRNIDILIFSWLNKNLPLEKFPYNLTGCQSQEEFYYRFRNILVPYEMFCLTNIRECRMISFLSKNKSMKPEDIYIESFANAVALSLPYISLTSNSVSWPRNKKLEDAAKNIYTTLESIFGEQKFYKILRSKIVDVIKLLFSFVCDKDGLVTELGWNGAIPFADKKSVSNLEINGILNYLNDKLGLEVIFSLCCDNPLGIQEILLHLWTEIELHHTCVRKIVSLHQYWKFCHFLPLCTKLDNFICSFIIHSLLHLISVYNKDENMRPVSVAACKMLYSMMKKMLPDLGNKISRLLSSIVHTVSQAILDNALLQESAMSLLVFLLIDMKSHLTIQSLDPLPNIECFTKLNQIVKSVYVKNNNTLHKQIETFLTGGLIGRYEGLKILHQNLKLSKRELSKMFDKLKQNRCFSEDCKNSILHNLTCVLIQIASNKTDLESSIQACRCLGELGVADYQTLILKPPQDPTVITGMSPLDYLTYFSLNQLRTLFFDSTPDIAKASSVALTSLLSTKEGKIALELVNQTDSSAEDLLLPFIPCKKTYTLTKLNIDNENFEEFVNNNNIWEASNGYQHSQWILSITRAALNSFSIQNCFLSDFVQLCKLNQSFSEKILPSLFGLVYSQANKKQVERLTNKIQEFFNKYYLLTFDTSNNCHSQDSQSRGVSSKRPQRTDNIFAKESVQCMLDIVQFIMIQKGHYNNITQSKNLVESNILGFDFLPIAWAANCNGAHFAAIYYGELWCINSKDLQLPSDPEKISSLPRGEDLLSIFRKSYLSIGDNDALNGCGLNYLLDPAERQNFYMRNGSFTDGLLLHDLSFTRHQNTIRQTSSTSCETSLGRNILSERSFVRSLQLSGLYHLAGRYMESSQTGPELSNMKYDCFWRLGDWSLQADTACLKSNTIKASTNHQIDSLDIWPAYQYIVLKDAVTRSIDTVDLSVDNTLRDAREFVTLNCIQNTLESCQSAYHLATKLQILQEIEHFVKMKLEESRSASPFSDLISDWSVENLFSFSDFKHMEPIIAQRVVVLESLTDLKPKAVQLHIAVSELILQYADLALSHGWVQAATRWINSTSCMSQKLCTNVSSGVLQSEESGRINHLSGLIRLAEGKVAWRNGHTHVALHLVKTFITNRNKFDDQLYANALRLYGSWMVETRSEGARDILENYLNKSLEVLGANGNTQAKIDAYLTIARFSDGEYKQVDSYMKSSAFDNKIKCMERCEDTARTLTEKNQNVNLTKDERKALYFNKGQRNIDETEIVNTRDERDHYLQLAIRYYLSALCDGDDNNLCVFRVISLWLDNPTLKLQGNKSLLEFFQSIPSRKFLPVIPQLAPRINCISGKPYQQIIYIIIERCLIEHPHHTLPIVLALKNSNKDLEYPTDANEPSQLTNSEPYIDTAKKMLEGVIKKGNNTLTNIIRETEILSLALISLANLKIKQPMNSKMNEMSIPKTETLKKLKNLKCALVPTVVLPVSRDGKYDNFPSVSAFSDKFELVGGVNMPKKISCRGSDGIERPMLLKGEDDIRQDAVMQQVFAIVNHLLASNQQTRKRRLLIRTYKVVVLSRRSGVLEWCEGTEPLGRLLVGNNGLGGYHARLRPNDMSSKDARNMMNTKRTASNESKLKVFKAILSKMKPVFHYFFIENFLLPAVWYERRLAYIHSVATSSMIGYILGLGDRHVQNILIDKSTAEVIHIDLGIAFEQGRVQPTPETVPFRLTQDMVAGMGSAGIEGVFRRCCEKTMDVLKENQETLLTILEVLLYDPLYMWTISLPTAYSKQDLPTPSTTHNNESVGTGSEAERALLRVKNKLESVEFGSSLATPGQVSRLLQQATDLNNLSRLFPGWQPYL